MDKGMTHQSREEIESLAAAALTRLNNEYENGDITYDCVTEIHQTIRSCILHMDDLRKQLNAAVLLGEAAASLQPEKLNGGEIMAECFRAYEVKHVYEDFAAGWLAAFRHMGAIKE